jgi:hypothetical protein
VGEPDAAGSASVNSTPLIRPLLSLSIDLNTAMVAFEYSVLETLPSLFASRDANWSVAVPPPVAAVFRVAPGVGRWVAVALDGGKLLGSCADESALVRSAIPHATLIAVRFDPMGLVWVFI